MNSSEIFHRFVETVLPADDRQIKWLLGWNALFLGIGFWAAEVTSGNYLALREFAPVWVWGLLFTGYGLKRLLGCVFQMPFGVIILFSSMGLYLWGYLFISFVLFDNTDVQATEYMLVFPLIAELWLLSKLIFDVVYINYNKS